MGFFGKILQATALTIALPVNMVKDAITMGGALNDQDEPYTVQNVKEVGKKLADAYDELGDL
jgi:hypothetical protein